MGIRKSSLFFCLFLTACASKNSINVKEAHSFTVEKYSLDESRGCRRSDINVNNARAEKFFRRAKQVEYRVIHDSYDIAPCSVSGSVTYNGKKCNWSINAGGTGWINCLDSPDSSGHNFACDNCDDLLTHKDS